VENPARSLQSGVVMNRLLLAGVTLLSMAAGPAMAADLAPKPIYKAPPLAPAWSWNGFYVGGNVGYGWAADPTTLTDSTTTTSSTSHNADVPSPTFIANPTIITTASASANANANGWLGGLQAGHNWQSGTFVFGLEGDIQITGQKGSVTLCDTAGCPGGTGIVTANYKLPWFGTLRGRLGVTPAPRWLVYFTGGLAVGEVDEDLAGAIVGGAPGTLIASSHTTRAGFVVGGGVESALTNNWTLKLEYLYMDFGNVGATAVGAPVTTATFNGPRIETIAIATTTAGLSTRATDNIVRLGLNYLIAPN
jgi:outer membrane immunogenic protein